MASEPHWAKKPKQTKPEKIHSWWKIFVRFFQQKLRKSLFSLSLSFLLKKHGKKRKSWRRKRKRKKQMRFLKVGGDFCHGKTCNIPLTDKLEGCIPAQHGLGNRPAAFLWWVDMVVAHCPSSRILQQLQHEAGKRREIEKVAEDGNKLSQC